MKREAVGHTKMKRLCRYLDIPLYQAVGLLELLWKITEREAPRGDIGKLSNEEIAIGLDYRGDEDALTAALIRANWLDVDPEFRIVVHDWSHHCEDSVHVKLARAGTRFADGSIPRMVKLTKEEREVCAQKFDCAHGVRTPCAQNSDPSALPTRAGPGLSLGLSLALPETAKPDTPVESPVAVSPPAIERSLSPMPPLWPPLPDVSMLAREKSLIAANGRGCSEWALRLYLAHPKKRDRVLAEQTCAELWASFRDPPHEAAEIEQTHSLWCRTQAWTEKSGQFAPRLAAWLLDRGYLSPPPEPRDALDELLDREAK